MIDSIKQKLEKLNLLQPTSHKKAGVFIGILYFDEFIDNPEILFTKRSSKMSTHAGETSYPGGKWEKGDQDLYQTSLRESYEEINLNKDDVTELGALHYLISRHDIEVNPFVGLITKKQDFIANEEIAEIFTVPLSYLLNKENAIKNEMERKNKKIIIPSWVYNGHKIWGLTAMITADLLNTCFDADIPSDLDIIREQYDR